MRARTTAVGLLLLPLTAMPPVVMAQVSGIVLDRNQQPIPGALVTLRATTVRATSGPDGRFAFPDLTGSNLVIVAARAGYFNASATVTSPAAGVHLALDSVPQTDDPAYPLAAPSTCGSCHPDQLLEWLGSPMANAGINTWLYDTYDGSGTPGGLGGFVYLRDSALAHEHPASECASCHEPESWIENPFTAITGLDNPTPEALHGISCDVCHKIAHVDETKINAPGIYPGVVIFTRPSGPDFHQVQYGMLGDVDFNRPAEMRASYQPQLEAAVCGTCHQDTNDPDLDGDFNEPNSIISEPTFLEWLNSPYGDEADPRYQNCLDCHMPPAAARAICNVAPVPRPAGTTRSHRIEGSTPEFLENAAELAFSDASIAGGELAFDVQVINSLTGHHVPTGVTVRNMILLVEARRDGDPSPLPFTGSQVIHTLGGVGDPAHGYYAGLPGKLFAKVIYDGSGNFPTFFTDAAGMLFDNRIPALATDVSSYRFGVPPGDSTLRVRARLIYRRSFRALTDAKGWTEDGHGNPLADVAPPDWGHLMESAELTMLAVDCTGKPAGAPCNDGNACNGSEVCDGAGACVAGTALSCDDANPCTTDRCDPASGCTHAANTDPCDDQNACTGGDACHAGTCAGTPVSCDDGDPCTIDTCVEPAGCANVAAPRLDCSAAARAAVDVRDSGNDARDRLVWRWSHGDGISAYDLGAPDSTSRYTLCVYDHDAGAARLATTLDVVPQSAWRRSKAGQWSYTDKSAAQDGVKVLRLKPGDAGKARLVLTAAGPDLPMPASVGTAEFFTVDPMVTLQLVNGETGRCWASTFGPSDVKANRGDRFKAR